MNIFSILQYWQKTRTSLIIFSTVFLAGCFPLILYEQFKNKTPFSTPTEKISQEELEQLQRQNVGIRGYDPVSYFAINNHSPSKGFEGIFYEHEGAYFRFKSKDHRDIFIDNPKIYTPLYEGSCLSRKNPGHVMNIQPDSWAIRDSKLRFFFCKDSGTFYPD